MDDEEKVDMILEWASEHENFDTNFVEEMQEILLAGKTLSVRQSTALENIIERWKVDYT